MKFPDHCKILAALIAFSLPFISLNALAAAKPAKQAAAVRNKIIFQVSDDDMRKWNMVLGNAKNVQQDLGESKVVIEVVVYGPGLGMLTFDSPVGSEVADAINAGIKFVACERTMRGLHLSKDDMLPSLGYVSSGVVELMLKQQEGYAYIKP